MAGSKSAVIIGAGIGGIATAIYLAKNGYSVNIYEKNSSPGGRCGQLMRDGHRFDLGATMLMMPNIYREVFNSLGIPLFENNTSFYVHAPVRTDVSAAPENHDTLSIVVGAGHLDKKKKQDWEEHKKKTENMRILPSM